MESREKCYPVSVVAKAIEIAAFGSAGVLEKEKASEALDSMPEEIQEIVMLNTILAHRKQKTAVEEAMIRALKEKLTH